jgi:urease accessory protein
MARSTPTEVRPARVAVLAGADGGPEVVQLYSGVLTPRIVRRGTDGVHVALITTTATLLGGDSLDLEVEVGPDLRLSLADVAGTVAYHGRGRSARVSTTLRVRAGATLVWAGEPLVVTEGARVERRLVADVEAGGRLLWRDQVALGREGERAGSLLCQTDVTYAGEPALVETLDLRAAADRDAPGVLGPHRVVDSVTAVGWRPDPSGPAAPGVSVYGLARRGALARQLVAASHESLLPRLWSAWVAQLG